MSGDDDLEQEFIGWHWWTGVSGILYVRRERSSPPVVFRGETMDDLKDQVRKHLAERAQR